jgi:MFS transporter, DHA1 family, multidrug resistance protein
VDPELRYNKCHESQTFDRDWTRINGSKSRTSVSIRGSWRLTDAHLAKTLIAILSRQIPQEQSNSLTRVSPHYRKAPPFRIAPGSRWFTVLLAMIVTLPSFSIDSCLASMSNIGVSLHAPPAATALVLSLFMVGFGCGQVIFGPLCDRLGRRPALLLGCALFILAAVGCAVAPSIESLVFWRFIQGAGAAAGSVIVFAVVRDLFTGTAARTRFAYVNVVAMIAPMVAPTLGGVIAAWAGWRAVFFLLAFGGTLLALLIALSLEESIHSRNRHALVLTNLVANYSRVLSHRTCLGYALVGGLSFGCLFAYVSGSAFVFIEVFKVDAHVYGALFAVNAFCLAIGAFTSGKLATRRVSGRRIIITGLAIGVVASSLLLAFAIIGIMILTLTMPLLMLSTLATGLVGPNVVHGTLEPLPEIAGVASSVFGAIRMLIGAIASELVAIFYRGTSMAMSETMTLFAAAALVVACLLFLPAWRRGRDLHPEARRLKLEARS